MSLDVYLNCDKCGAQCFEANITHNLTRMADAAGIYQHLWRPEELGISKAGELIEPLQQGLQLLVSDPARFKKFDPENGWGDYHGLVRFVTNYLEACRKAPDSDISTCR